MSLTVSASGITFDDLTTLSSTAPVPWTVVTSGRTLTKGSQTAANTSAGAFTLTLPSSPAAGDWLSIVDYSSTWGTNNLSVAGNGSSIGGDPTNLICDVSGKMLYFTFVGGSTGWQVFFY